MVGEICGYNHYTRINQCDTKFALPLIQLRCLGHKGYKQNRVDPQRLFVVGQQPHKSCLRITVKGSHQLALVVLWFPG